MADGSAVYAIWAKHKHRGPLPNGQRAASFYIARPFRPDYMIAFAGTAGLFD